MSALAVQNTIALIAIFIAVIAHGRADVYSDSDEEREKKDFWTTTKYISIGVVVCVLILQLPFLS